MNTTRRAVQLGFLTLTLVGVFYFGANCERWCPFGGVEALYAYVAEGDVLCSLGVSNFFILGGVLLSVLYEVERIVSGVLSGPVVTGCFILGLLRCFLSLGREDEDLEGRCQAFLGRRCGLGQGRNCGGEEQKNNDQSHVISPIEHQSAERIPGIRWWLHNGDAWQPQDEWTACVLGRDVQGGLQTEFVEQGSGLRVVVVVTVDRERDILEGRKISDEDETYARRVFSP